MSLIGLVLVLIIIGVCLYLINNYLPIDAKIKKIINIIVVVAVVIWIIGLLLGGWTGVNSIWIGRR